MFNKIVGLVALVFLSLISVSIYAEATSDIEKYGQSPKYRSFSISPDGKHYTYIQRSGNTDVFVVLNAETKQVVGSVDGSKLKARSVRFVTNNHVVLDASETKSHVGYTGQWEQWASYVYNLKTKKLDILLRGVEGVPVWASTGWPVGYNLEKELVYIPVRYRANGRLSGRASYSLFRVDLNTGRAKLHAKGLPTTRGWFVNKKGEPIVTERYSNKENMHRIYSKVSGKWELIYEKKTEIPEISISAISPDEKSLIFFDGDSELYQKNDEESLYSMSLLDGEITGPLYYKEGLDISHILRDENKRLEGVAYAGYKSSYTFSNPKLTAVFDVLNEIYPSSNVSYVASTKNDERIIFKVSGNEGAGNYKLFDMKENSIKNIASNYPVIKKIAKHKVITYKTRDGLEISGVLTLPFGLKHKPNQLPLIVMPHGGPSSYDNLSFDWQAQYLAKKGYLVLQPNFRGSRGFGRAFRLAGEGEWGKKMQDDVSDGVLALIELGYADKDRVCIMGSSYGGYSALAGGAFSPELYRCIISMAGVSHLPKMLSYEKEEFGEDHWVISYWEKLIANSDKHSTVPKEVSPYFYASNFEVPVLLIHGKDDTVVPIRQSKLMAKALKKAGKKVEFIALKGDDHWFSNSQQRLASLKAVDKFLDKYNPVKNKSL